MIDPGQKLNVALLAVPESTAWTLFGVYDLLSSTGRDWELLTAGRPGDCPIVPRIVARDREGFRAANGAWIRPDAGMDEPPTPQVVYVAALQTPPGQTMAGRYPREAEWIAEAHRRGAVVASAGSGALLLAEAGLLDGRNATTHWGYAEALEKAYPTVRTHAERVLVAAGDRRRIITAGGGISWQNLVLFLVARFFGVEEAMRLARVHLIEWQPGGRLPFCPLTQPRQEEDRIIASCQEWIADHYASPSPVAAMMRLSGLTERTFKRRFTKAAGVPPIDYVHILRLEEAKRLLETSGNSVETVANKVGYEDTTFFRRLFRRSIGLSPREYRARVSALRAALEDAVET